MLDRFVLLVCDLKPDDTLVRLHERVPHRFRWGVLSRGLTRDLRALALGPSLCLRIKQPDLYSILSKQVQQA